MLCLDLIEVYVWSVCMLILGIRCLWCGVAWVGFVLLGYSSFNLTYDLLICCVCCCFVYVCS